MNTQENLKRGILVDEQDMHLLSKYLFYTNFGYPRTMINGKAIYLHKLISADNKDHINGNKLDNRRFNLRPATHAENSYNQKRPKNNTSGYKGVFKDKNKWRAAIMFGGRTINLGSYTIKEEAALNYDIAAKKYYGKFANLNFNLELT